MPAGRPKGALNVKTLAKGSLAGNDIQEEDEVVADGAAVNTSAVEGKGDNEADLCGLVLQLSRDIATQSREINMRIARLESRPHDAGQVDTHPRIRVILALICFED